MSSRSGTVRKRVGTPMPTAIVGDGGGQVGLAAAVTALQQQPAVQRAGVLPGVVEGPFERVGLRSPRPICAARLESSRRSGP